MSTTARRGSAKRPAAMVDVAKLADVSQKTVSRVVNGEPHVSEKVRNRVLAAIEELSFRPNTAARALVTARSRVIGFISTDSALFGPNSMSVGVEQAARAAGYSIAVLHTPDGTPASVKAAFDDLLGRGAEGIVVSEPADDLDFSQLPSRGVPVLALEYRAGSAGDWILAGVDDRAASRAATEHLLDLGHETVWHVSGPAGWGTSHNRILGWRDALDAAGRQIPQVVRGDWSADSGFVAGRALADRTDVTAVVAANDEMAIGAISAFEQSGLRVPDDISIVGIDDIPLAGYLHVPLTTMRQDFDAVTREGMSRLLDAIEGREPTSRQLALPADLIVRGTTAPPRTHRS